MVLLSVEILLQQQMALQVSSSVFSRNSILNSRPLPVGAADFERLVPIRFTNNADICLFTASDRVTLEYDDRILLRFSPDNPGLIPGVEAAEEHQRHCKSKYKRQ